MELRKILPVLLAVSLLLGGCAWLDGSYVSVTPHRVQTGSFSGEGLYAQSEMEFREILEQMVSSGKNSAVVYVGGLSQPEWDRVLARTSSYLRKTYPIGAYALESISLEQGITGGNAAVAVEAVYRHSSVDIQKVKTLMDMDDAVSAVRETLENCSPRAVFLVEKYQETDFSQLVQNIAQTYPDLVMETPRVEENIFGKGSSRVVELVFTYENSRNDLRQMQSQVKPVFDAAALYVSGEGADFQKFGQLYAFLMERYEYKIDTSITPAYSLLRHGVGDSRAFATVYAAMCRRAGLECRIVTGTRQGEPWVWNMVWDNGNPFHVDLLACSDAGIYRERTDGEMNGYVWDFSAYPPCEPPVADTAEPAVEAEETDGLQEKATVPATETSIGDGDAMEESTGI